MDRGVDCSSQCRAAGGIKRFATGPLASLGQLFERIGDNASGLLAHLATRLVGQGFAHGMHDISALLLGQAQGVAGFCRQTCKTSHRKRHGLRCQVQAGLCDCCGWVFQGKLLGHARALGFRL
ncbi:MAG: hypothetical protein KAX99_04275 [Azonexus sp.]|nr:hypothetical protein [Azonexus sp.]